MAWLQRSRAMPRLLSSPQPWFPWNGEEGERKMSSLTGFTKKGGQVLQKSSSVFRRILFRGGGGGSGTLWPLRAPMVPVEASVRNRTGAVDVPISFLILRLQHRSSCFEPHGDRTPLLLLLLQLASATRTKKKKTLQFYYQKRSSDLDRQKTQRKTKPSDCESPENLHGHPFYTFQVRSPPLSWSNSSNLHKNEPALCGTDATSVLIRINWNL